MLINKKILISLFTYLLAFIFIDNVVAENVLTDSLARVRTEKLPLPILYITTMDSVMPPYEVVYPPEGQLGRGITNNEKVPARMWIVEQGDTVYDSGAYQEKTSGLTIKVRGNTSAASGHDKKPYKLKLQKSADLLFRGDDKYADKEWLLIYNIYETIVGNMTNRLFEMPWVPAQKLVFVFLNGNFRGEYLLSESVKRNQQCRVDVSKTGFLFEFDAYWWNEDYYIPSSRYKLNYTMKYPESDEIKPWQEQYLTDYINRTEAAYSNEQQLINLVDINSYVKWLWVHEILGSYDGAGSNMYFMKYDTTANSKLSMMCAWDFDACFFDQVKKHWASVHKLWWYKDMFDNGQMYFIKKYVNFYERYVVRSFDVLIGQIDSLITSPFMAAIDSAHKIDNERWNFNNYTASDRMAELADYLSERKTDMDMLMRNLKYSYYINETRHGEYSDKLKAAYDILGNPVSPESQTGIVILLYENGRVEKRLNKK